MYRTPMRRGHSPDSPNRGQRRDSPHSRENSWSRGHSPARRSPARRGRTPDRRARSPDRRGRSRSRPRSRSRGRAGRSRSRPRRSPSPYSQYSCRRRSPGDSYRHEGRSGEKSRLSPSYRSAATSNPPVRSGGVKAFGHDSSPRVYQSSGDSHAISLPMPKKSILKKRSDVETTSHDQSPQVDTFSNVKDGRSASSAGAETSAEKNNITESPLPVSAQIGLLKSSACSPGAAPKPESPQPHGSTQPTATSTNWTLITNTDMGMKGTVAGGKTSPCQSTDSSKVTQYNSSIGNLLFNLNAPKSQSSSFGGMNVFPEQKEVIQKGSQEAGGFLLPHEQGSKSSLPSKPLDPRLRSSTEIEDEERFLYGDEEDNKPKPQKPPSGQTHSAPPVKLPPNKQEFEKIHDLLKTIGLDIGVAEIGKLAVRTQERLHGKKLTPKMTQPAAELPPTAATAIPVDPKAKVSEPQGKTENKEGAEAAVKTEPSEKPAPKEATPPVTQPSPIPVLREKPQLVLRKSLPKEKTAAPKVEVPVQSPAPSPVPDPTPPPISPSQMHPVYPQYSHSPMVPAYSMPHPSYNPYGPYLSYPPSSWTMYSPVPPQPLPPHMPSPTIPHMSVSDGSPAHMYQPRSNLRVIETTEDVFDFKAASKPKNPLAALLAKQEADRKNKESEKMKVLEELDSVRKEHKLKNENLKTLSAKVEQLRIQQGLLLRKKRREKDGHKDPLLEELNSVLESAQKQISSLHEEISTTKQKQQQLTKVAEILGVNPTELVEKSEPKKEERSSSSPTPPRDSDNESRTSNDSKSANDLKTSSDPLSKIDLKAKSSSKTGADAKSLGAAHLPNVTKKSEDVQSKGTPPGSSPTSKNSPEPHSPCLSKSEDTIKSRDKSRSKSPQPCPPPSKTLPQSEEPRPFDISEVFDYYDSGSHWCEDCNAICLTLLEFLLHLHEKKHNQCVKEVKRPWVKKRVPEPSTSKKQKVNVPLKGTEFMIPVNGYYCELCDELFPDHVTADLHLKAYAHNDKFKKYTDAHVNYEAIRREKKKVKLTLAQEMARRQTQQKRIIAEQKREDYEHSRSKKVKKEEEDRKAKAKRHTSASPPYSEQKRNKTPEKEPAKNSAFKKFAWKPVENKSQAVVSSSRVDTALNKPKEEEPKVLPIKPKGFAIKLLGKPSTVSGNALSLSHSATSTAVTTTTATSTSSTSAASSTAASTTTTITSTAPTKVRPDLPNQLTIRPDLPNQLTIRPNLPSPLNIRSPAPSVTMSKPAPLNTFLSIRSSNDTSKSIPIMNNDPTGVLSKELVSKAFGGEVVMLKESAQPNATDKTEKEQNKKTGQSPEALQKTKGQDLFKVFISEKETVENKAVQSVKESSVSKLPLDSFPQKPGPVLTSASRTTFSGPTKPAPLPESVKVQQTQNRKSPVSNPALFPVSSTTSVKFPISSSTNGSSNGAKSDSTITPSNQKTGNAEFTPSGVQKPQDTKAPSKLEKETHQEVKASPFSLNPMTGRMEYLPIQETKDTNVQKLPETKRTPTTVTYVSKVNPNKPFSTPPVPVLKIKPAFNATTKLNQKFKKAPLSLPSSLFGHVQDAGCKDIKITSIESQRSINRADKSESPLLPPAVNQVSPIVSAKPSILQQELDSYYKLIATEEDPEDLTTSEDQDLETSPATVNVTKVPQPTKVENLPQKRANLEITPPPVKTPTGPVVPEVSGEDPDDSDMACEVPEVPSSSVSQTSGWSFMQSSYTSNQSYCSNNRQTTNVASGNGSKVKDQSMETHVATAVTSESSMEDLSVCVTCDSD